MGVKAHLQLASLFTNSSRNPLDRALFQAAIDSFGHSSPLYTKQFSLYYHNLVRLSRIFPLRPLNASGMTLFFVYSPVNIGTELVE